jgi:4-hydroxy-tetrahydrodipicolinate synthase
MKGLEGTFVAAVTPFAPNEGIDLDAFGANVDFYIDNGVHGIVVGASTGEFAALSLEEHKKIIKNIVNRVKGRVPVIAGTGACSTRRVVELTMYAKQAGAECAMIVPPFYTKPNEKEIYEHFRTVAEAVDISIMLYNNPFTSKVDMLPSLIAKLAEIDNIEYTKESSGDITRVWKIINLTKGKMTVFCGTDNLALESFLMGAKGWVCVAANFLPKQTSELYKLACKEDNIEEARELYDRILPVMNLLEDTGKFQAMSKAAIEMIGMKAGLPRKPLLPLSREEKQKLETILKKIRQT